MKEDSKKGESKSIEVLYFYIFWKTVKDVDSELSGGLNRTLLVYDYNGDLIKTYTGKIDIEASDVSGKVKFDMDGKRTIIYGGIVIVDEQ